MTLVIGQQSPEAEQSIKAYSEQQSNSNSITVQDQEGENDRNISPSNQKGWPKSLMPQQKQKRGKQPPLARTREKASQRRFTPGKPLEQERYCGNQHCKCCRSPNLKTTSCNKLETDKKQSFKSHKDIETEPHHQY